MAKQSQIDKAIAELEREILQLTMALDRLKLFRESKPKAVRKPRIVKAKSEAAG